MASEQYSRLDKINQSINRKISELIIHKCNDPRIGMLVINKVIVSPDLGRARIFFSPVDKNVKNVDGTLKGLDAAAGFLRSELAKDSTSLVAQGHCFVGPEAAPIGEDGAVLANPLGNHTKVVLWPQNINPKELVAMPTAPKSSTTTI